MPRCVPARRFRVALAIAKAARRPCRGAHAHAASRYVVGTVRRELDGPVEGALTGAVRPTGSPGRSRTYVASPDSKSGGPCRQTNWGKCVANPRASAGPTPYGPGSTQNHGSHGRPGWPKVEGALARGVGPMCQETERCKPPPPHPRPHEPAGPRTRCSPSSSPPPSRSVRRHRSPPHPLRGPRRPAAAPPSTATGRARARSPSPPRTPGLRIASSGPRASARWAASSTRSSSGATGPERPRASTPVC